MGALHKESRMTGTASTVHSICVTANTRSVLINTVAFNPVIKEASTFLTVLTVYRDGGNR